MGVVYHDNHWMEIPVSRARRNGRCREHAIKYRRKSIFAAPRLASPALASQIVIQTHLVSSDLILARPLGALPSSHDVLVLAHGDRIGAAWDMSVLTSANLSRAADESDQLEGGCEVGAKGAGQEVVGELRVNDLKETVRLTGTLEPVLPKISNRDPGRQVMLDEVVGGSG